LAVEELRGKNNVNTLTRPGGVAGVSGPRLNLIESAFVAPFPIHLAMWITRWNLSPNSTVTGPMLRTPLMS
jgi:hypothetical protein